MAIKDVNEAFRLKPNYARAYAVRGIIYMKSASRELACDDFIKACELNFCSELERIQIINLFSFHLN